jgi:hypothetical protein
MIRRITCLILSLVFSGLELSAQVKQQDNRTNFLDFILLHDQVWGLTTKGTLQVYSLATYRKLPDPPADDSVVAIARDRTGRIIIGNKRGQLKVLDSNSMSWKAMGAFTGLLHGIAFDRANHCFVITSEGVGQPGTTGTYFPDSMLNSQIRYHGKWSKRPVFCMDPGDNLWIGFGYGEWGGDIFAFDTHGRAFRRIDLNGFEIMLNPIQSICNRDSSIFISCGLQHFDNSGMLASIREGKVSVVFDSSPYSKVHLHDTTFHAEYLGAITYNPDDQLLYFYSQHGIFKGEPGRYTTRIDQWERVAQPLLKWSYGQPDAVGYTMNVRKIEFTDDHQLVFLSTLDGIGVILGGRTIHLHD